MNVLVNRPVALTGLLVVFEGIDGSGKSTISKEITEYLNKSDIAAEYLFEPTKDGYGAIIRNKMVYDLNNFSVEEQASLFVLDRENNRKVNIEPALNQNKVVLLDRYFYSSIAYQAATGEFNPQNIFNFNKPVILNPDIVIFFDTDVNKALSRINTSRESSSVTDYEKVDFLKNVQKIYRKMEAPNIHTVNADDPLDKLCTNAIRLVEYAIERKNSMVSKYNKLSKCLFGEELDNLWNRIYKETYGIKN